MSTLLVETSRRATCYVQYRHDAPGRARAVATEFLKEHPRQDEVELIVSELVTNAILHARGVAKFLRCYIQADGPTVRIEVSDDGSRSTQTEREDGEGGLGLLIVDALADKAGHDETPGGGVWWAELS